MKNKKVILALLAGLMICSAGISGTLAYFTTYTEAQGGYPIHLGNTSRVKEELSNWTKHVVITNDEESESVFIRVKAFSGMEYLLTYSDESGSWNPGEEGFYYYDKIVAAGEETSLLDIHINNIPEDVKDSEGFNVVVVYEATRVLYDTDGNPYADWTQKVTTTSVKEVE